eukprot:CAMPEP_0201510912 /NCGR_PEP_ID=MMETSP0161_2-20130828/3445_1 /ASSEMBLY_ACC=CAM_ASM_000251 /TAXON_ID=180227 /ORGANISM="Neoparamoeba aestuarina, Strain SoJaBio B1-5/56/2" /LENGTH=472 /DNA_ID=CAMNT_0047906189 /DNA_START=106 /DNA_END=1524 /DNA_ORIENTATION=+
MSDEEFDDADFGFDDDDVEFEFEDDDDDFGGGDSLQDMICNHYLCGKSKYKDDNEIAEALQEFESAVELNETLELCDQTKWGFKSYLQMCLIHYETSQQDNRDTQKYLDLSYSLFVKALEGVRKTKSIPIKEKNIVPFIDALEHHPKIDDIVSCADETLSLRKLEAIRLKLLLRVAKQKYKAQRWNEFAAVLVNCREVCSASGLQYNLDEVIAMEILLCSHLNEINKIRELYQEFQSVSGLPTPEVNAIIREAGGKIHMLDNNWGLAFTDFFEAFRSFNDRADSRAVQCLKYVLVAAMLKPGPEIDPFTESNTKSHEEDAQIKVMKELLYANRAGNVILFEKILQSTGQFLSEDSFLSPFIPHLRTQIRTKGIQKAVQPYSRITLNGLSQLLGIPVATLPHLLSLLISEKKIKGTIDQERGVLILHRPPKDQTVKDEAIGQWQSRLSSLQNQIFRQFDSSTKGHSGVASAPS